MLKTRLFIFISAILLYFTTNAAGLFLWTDQKYPNTYIDSLENDDTEQIVAIVIVEDNNSFLKTNQNGGGSVTFKNLVSNPMQPKNKHTLFSNLFGSEIDEDYSIEEDFGGLKLTSQQKSMLRKSWRSSCDRRAAKTCAKACNLARKNVCEAYRCKKSLSKRFRKECKRSCKSKFLGSSRDKSEADSE